MIPKDKPIITLSHDQIRDIQEKARTRQQFREQIIKERSNPFRHIAANGSGYIEDLAFTRLEATQSFMNAMTHFKLTPRTVSWWFFGVFTPLIGFAYLSESKRRSFDTKCRQGEIAYGDRNNKFV